MGEFMSRLLLTDHDVGLGRGFLNDFRGIVVAVDELRGRVLGFHGLGALFVAHEQGVGVLGVGFVQGVENVTADIAWDGDRMSAL